MIDALDSRALRYTDCYGQRFMKAGTYRYHVLPVGGECFTTHRPYTVEVAAGAADAQMKQHDVKVSFAAGRFTVEPEVLSIAQGDMVLWHAPNGRALPYTVVGEKPFFASDRLVNESGYSHAFGAAGEYRWRDAHGGRTEGLVRVRDPQCGTKADLDAWHAALATGTVVTITDGVATPKEVSILTGQTVFFAVTKGPGLSITDARLLEGEGRRTAS